MATVWVARLKGKHGFERMVALKAILPALAQDPRFRQMFLDEARIASRVEHVNVAQILDLGEQDGNLYLVMEWVDGDSLSNLSRVLERAKGTTPLWVLLRVLAEACAGLHAAHELCDEAGRPLGVVHRDVSPQNILIGSNGVAKVIDFGVAKARGRAAEDTSAGTIKGKLHYMAPEQAIGTVVDRRADVWAIGAVLYRLLANRPAYEGDNALATLNLLISRMPPPDLPSTVPSAVTSVVMKALAPDPNDRYATAAELQRELEKILHDSPLSTTNRDVAAFVATHLGPQLAARRSAISAALEGKRRASLADDAPAATASESGVLSSQEYATRPASTPVEAASPAVPSRLASLKFPLLLLGAVLTGLGLATLAFGGSSKNAATVGTSSAPDPTAVPVPATAISATTPPIPEPAPVVAASSDTPLEALPVEATVASKPPSSTSARVRSSAPPKAKAPPVTARSGNSARPNPRIVDDGF